LVPGYSGLTGGCSISSLLLAHGCLYFAVNLEVSQQQEPAMSAPQSPSIASPRYPAPELRDLPDDIRAKVLEVQEKAGFIPNVFLALARRPAEWRAFFAYHDALMLREESGLTKGDREMIVTTTSAANNCLYCVVAHGAILRIYEKKPLVADQVAVNYRKADITPRQRAMLDFAMKVCLRSGTSLPSPPSSACPTALPASPACCRIRSSI